MFLRRAACKPMRPFRGSPWWQRVAVVVVVNYVCLLIALFQRVPQLAFRYVSAVLLINRLQLLHRNLGGHRVTLWCKPGSANHPDLRVPRAATSWASCLFAADESNVGYLTF
ncbi:hypothetical protein D9B73_14725 [Serratia marcescens]|nr:hypothetical protein C7M66_24240 [Serratia marcescens]AXX25056.1 hypothetical protein C7M65_13770 [Serratia marcescens]RTE99047.1 hypothetical protein C7M70_11340 [Serratia marcescens]RTF00460.1 hypothetical protein C7M68_16315 [Serratia marcescens]RTF08327.1 hypothetical protein C7M69_07560 [Serratia marcescens]